jgi:Cu/Ag efflux pump CusA
MLGGVVSSAVLSLVIIPILFEIYAKWGMRKNQ